MTSSLQMWHTAQRNGSSSFYGLPCYMFTVWSSYSSSLGNARLRVSSSCTHVFAVLVHCSRDTLCVFWSFSVSNEASCVVCTRKRVLFVDLVLSDPVRLWVDSICVTCVSVYMYILSFRRVSLVSFNVRWWRVIICGWSFLRKRRYLKSDSISCTGKGQIKSP